MPAAEATASPTGRPLAELLEATTTAAANSHPAVEQSEAAAPIAAQPHPTAAQHRPSEPPCAEGRPAAEVPGANMPTELDPGSNHEPCGFIRGQPGDPVTLCSFAKGVRRGTTHLPPNLPLLIVYDHFMVATVHSAMIPDYAVLTLNRGYHKPHCDLYVQYKLYLSERDGL